MASKPRRTLRGLYAITPQLEDTGELVRRVQAAIDGGAALVQYRSKLADGALRLQQAMRLAAVCRSRGVALIVNDSIEIALAAGADGVHIGRDDGDTRAARAAMAHGIVGVSCYDDLGRARAAAAAGADYIGIGSMFASTTKPGAVRAQLDLVARAHEASGLPVAAIGGITALNAPGVVAAGADMLAIVSAVFDAPDICSAARGFARLFDPPPSGTDDVRTQPRPV